MLSKHSVQFLCSVEDEDERMVGATCWPAAWWHRGDLRLLSLRRRSTSTCRRRYVRKAVTWLAQHLSKPILRCGGAGTRGRVEGSLPLAAAQRHAARRSPACCPGAGQRSFMLQAISAIGTPEDWVDSILEIEFKLICHLVHFELLYPPPRPPPRLDPAHVTSSGQPDRGRLHGARPE